MPVQEFGKSKQGEAFLGEYSTHTGSNATEIDYNRKVAFIVRHNNVHTALPSFVQGAMEATFTAFKSGSPTAQLEPVTRSSIAKRRQNKKSSTSL